MDGLIRGICVIFNNETIVSSIFSRLRADLSLAPLHVRRGRPYETLFASYLSSDSR